MQQRLILPSDVLMDSLAPYEPYLGPLGVDAWRLIEYVIPYTCTCDNLSCQSAIRKDLLLWQEGYVPTDDELTLQVVETCMEAVEVTARQLTQELQRLYGRIPPRMAIIGYAGNDPVVDITIELHT